MARVNSAQWLDKWGRRLSAAGPDITAGINRVQEAPGVKAAASAQLMLQKLTESITSGVWAKNVSAVSLGAWRDAAINKGVPRIQQGIAGAQKNKGQVIDQLLTAVDAAAAVSNALPKGGIEQSIARASAFMREMSARAPKKQK